MKQHVFWVLVHKQPELLRRIITILAAPNHHFIVNIDKKTSNYIDFVNALNGIDNVSFLENRWDIKHAGISMVLCTIDMLKHAHSRGFDYTHLISGQDYPLRSNKQFDDFFENSEQSFMAIESESYHNSCMHKKYPDRVNYWHFNDQHTVFYKIWRHSGLMALFSKICKRPMVTQLWGGWQWFSWNLDTLSYILQYIENNPLFLSRFNHTSCADELFFISIVHGKEALLHINGREPLRYVSWRPKRRSVVTEKHRPYILNEEDYEDVINSRAFFCRKIDIRESAKLLDMIDEQRDNSFDFSKCNCIL